MCIARFRTKYRSVDNEIVYAPCGKCHVCKTNRVNGWAFRLQKEAERSSSALFVTLTYDTEYVPITENGYMTLDKTDLQKFMKRLRKINDEKLKYYAAGEYGGKTQRPHYHIILFNAKMKTLEFAWKLGHIHIGNLSPASANYTLKYINKNKIKKHERDDRQDEFQLMSKKLGTNYMTEKMVEYHRKDINNRMFITIEDGKKISMPRYYKDKIYTKQERKNAYKVRKEVEQHEYEKMDPWTAFQMELKKDLEMLEKQRRFERRTKNQIDRL